MSRNLVCRYECEAKPSGWAWRDKAIAVPLDGSAEAKTALPTARMISSVTGGRVHVLHAAQEPLSREQLLERLQLRRREDAHGIVIDQVVAPAVDGIVRRAADWGAVLVVMATRGRTYGHDGALSSVVKDVLRDAPCSVLLVRPEHAFARMRPQALRRILLPVDSAPSTLAMFGPAALLAEQSGAELAVLHVAPLRERAVDEPGTIGLPRYVDQPHHEWPAWLDSSVHRFCATARTCLDTVPVDVHVRYGEPGSEIPAFAAEHGVDLIVLGWHGHLDGMRGAIVRAVVAGSPCPVLLLRAPRSVEHEAYSYEIGRQRVPLEQQLMAHYPAAAEARR